MTVVQSMIKPEIDAIKSHLDALFAPAQREYPGGLVELRYGPPDHLDNWAYFNVRDEGLADAAKFAADMNNEGSNVYVGVNPRKPNTNTRKAASASDVEIAFYHFADIDRAESVVGLVERYGALPPTMTITTGTVPNKRPHLYWRLEEPVMNMAEWTERQRGLAQALGGDAVIDPPRIMRLGGTVNFPTPKKLEKGYKVELTVVRTEFANERADVSPDQIAATYPAASLPVAQTVPAGSNTLRQMGSKTRQLINGALSGTEWHNNVRDLTGRLARLGRTSDEILLMAAGLTLPGYTVQNTESEMRKALQGARVNFAIPEPADNEELSDEPDAFPTLSIDELEALPAPTYLVDEIIPEHGFTIAYGDPGAGKSFVILDMALRISHGMDWHGSAAKQVGVLYIAGEGRHGIGKRVKGWRREHALEGADAPFKLLPVAVAMLDKQSVDKLKRTITIVAAEVGFEIGLVIIDTVSRAIAGQDENKQEAMSLLVDGCAAIQDFTSGAVIGVHHAGKDKEKGMRGSSVLLGACDASIKITKDGEIVTLTMEKQKDDEEAAPIYMKMKKVEWSAGLGKPVSTLIPERSNKLVIEEKTLSRRQADEIFTEVDRAWTANDPWSVYPQAKRKARYIVDYIAEQCEVSFRVAEDHVTRWQSRGYMKSESSGANRAAGLRVLKHLEQDQ